MRRVPAIAAALLIASYVANSIRLARRAISPQQQPQQRQIQQRGLLQGPPSYRDGPPPAGQFAGAVRRPLPSNDTSSSGARRRENGGPEPEPFVLYVNDGCNDDWIRRMGHTGECVQSSALKHAFADLGIAFKEYVPPRGLLEAIAEAESSDCLMVQAGDTSIGRVTVQSASAGNVLRKAKELRAPPVKKPANEARCIDKQTASLVSEELCRDAATIVSHHRRPIILGAMNHEVAGWYAGRLASCSSGDGRRVPPRLRVALLSWFGVGPSHVLTHPNLPGGFEILSVLPAEGNYFLGYALEGLNDVPASPSLGAATSTASASSEEKYGVVLGKSPKYFTKPPGKVGGMKMKCARCKAVDMAEDKYEQTREVLHRASRHLPLKCTGCSAEGITDVGRLSKEKYMELLSGSRFLLGVGDPIGPPSVLEAISLGCLAVLPRGRKVLEMHGHTHKSQYDHLEELMEGQPSLRPYVCWYATLDELDGCVSRAADHEKLPRITIDAFTPESFRSRVRCWVYNEQ